MTQTESLAYETINGMIMADVLSRLGDIVDAEIEVAISHSWKSSNKLISSRTHVISYVIADYTAVICDMTTTNNIECTTGDAGRVI